MQHPDLIEKYKKAQKHFENGNFIRAKWIFEQIALELSASDTDSMGDIHLHNSAEEYLEKISEQKLSSLIIPFLVVVTLIIVIIIILFFVFR